MKNKKLAIKLDGFNIYYLILDNGIVNLTAYLNKKKYADEQYVLSEQYMLDDAYKHLIGIAKSNLSNQKVLHS